MDMTCMGYLKNKNYIYFFFFERFNLWRPLLIIALYHQTKPSICFWCRQELNLRSLIQPSKTLPVDLITTHTHTHTHTHIHIYIYIYKENNKNIIRSRGGNSCSRVRSVSYQLMNI